MEKLYDLLSEEEKEGIERYIRCYAETGDEGCDRASLDYILRYWDSNKNILYNLLGNKLILSKDICIEKDKDFIAQDIENQLEATHSIFSDFRWNFQNQIIVQNNWSPEELDCLYMLLDKHTLANNEYRGETCSLHLPDGRKPLVVQQGCKPMRAINTLCQIFHVPNFEKYRLKHSQILNDKIFKGELCLSIHPLDFMTMSDNTYDWSSCMSWQEEGCYRQGTVEMMNSPMVLVAYLNGNKPFKITSDLDWSNKKWRELFIINPDGIFAVKGYPIWNHQLERVVLEWINELTNNAYGPVVNFKPYVYADLGSVYENKKVKVRPSTGMMYNDFCYDHYACFSKEIKDNEEIAFNYSGPSECMRCGTELDIDDVEDEQCLICCGSYEVCDSCGCHIYSDENVYHIGNDTLCEECFCDQTVEDAINYYDPIYEDDSVKIKVIDVEHNTLVESYNDLYTDIRVLDVLQGRYIWDRENYVSRIKTFFGGDIPIYTIEIKNSWFGSYNAIAVDINDLNDKARIKFGLCKNEDGTYELFNYQNDDQFKITAKITNIESETPDVVKY